MAKPRFTFALAKEKIKDLETALLDEQAKIKELIDDAKLNQDDNIYDAGEQRFIKIYKYGFWISTALLIISLAV